MEQNFAGLLCFLKCMCKQILQISCLPHLLQYLCGCTRSCVCVYRVSMCFHACQCVSSLSWEYLLPKPSWLRVTAGLLCCPSKWISMGKQTQDADSHHKDTEIIQQIWEPWNDDSVAALIWTIREVCSDTTDGHQRAVNGQILRELWGQVRERESRLNRL